MTLTIQLRRLHPILSQEARRRLEALCPGMSGAQYPFSHSSPNILHASCSAYVHANCCQRNGIAGQGAPLGAPMERTAQRSALTIVIQGKFSLSGASELRTPPQDLCRTSECLLRVRP